MELMNQTGLILPEDSLDVTNLDVNSPDARAMIQRIEDGDIHLSFSAIKAFIESPRHFLAYKLRQRGKQTEQQAFGDLVDCLLTQEDKFDEKFFLRPVGADLSSEKGCREWLTVWNVRVPMGREFKAIKNLVKALIERENRTAITEAMLSEAKILVGKMKWNQPFNETLQRSTEFQKKVEFELYGWNWLGYLDLYCSDFVGDLKLCPSTAIRKVKNKIKDERIILQLALYAFATKSQEGRLLFYDRTGHFTAMIVNEADLTHELTMLERVIDKFELCIANGDWDKSRDFWGQTWDGFYYY